MKKITLLLAFILTTMLSFGIDMSGTYTVGTGSTYETLSAAVNALNSATITGNVVLEITSDITEPANIGLGVNTNGYSITIRPDADVDRTITFTKTTDNTSPSGHFVIGYTSAGLTSAWSDANTIPTNNVTINGYAVGGSTRRLKFTTASGSLTASRLIMIIAACENTTIRNCIIENKSTGASPVCVGTIARKYVGTGEGAPNGVIIENNIITSVSSPTGQGIMTSSSGTLVSAATTGLIIKKNIITARARGGWFYYIDGGEIEGNELRLVQSSTAVGTVNYGFWTGTGARGTFNIFNNKFIEASTFETSASGGLRVLSLGGGTPIPTYNVYNNTFAGLDRRSTTSNAVNLTYLFFGGQGTIYHNTFYMPALTQAVNTGYYSSIQLSSANPAIKNNIFITNEDATANAFYSAISTGVIDNNIFYFNAGVTNARFVTGTSYTTLNDYKAANTTKDQNSKYGNVNFVNAATGDLRIASASYQDANLQVTRLTEVMTDMFGTSRYPQTYKGAHEAEMFIINDNATPSISARILRTYEGVQIELESTSTVEIYTTSGMLIDKVRTSGTYTKDLNNGVYIIRIDGQATKFMK